MSGRRMHTCIFSFPSPVPLCYMRGFPDMGHWDKLLSPPAGDAVPWGGGELSNEIIIVSVCACFLPLPPPLSRNEFLLQRKHMTSSGFVWVLPSLQTPPSSVPITGFREFRKWKETLIIISVALSQSLSPCLHASLTYLKVCFRGECKGGAT